MKLETEYSVCQFFTDGSYEYVRRFVTLEQAIKASRHYCTSVGARLGVVERVMVTDGDDCVVFLWLKGRGIVWPHGFEGVAA